MSTLQEITSQESFSTHVSSLSPKTLLALSFHAPWAAPCAQMRTILETLASTYAPTHPPEISFVSIDAESLPEISESYDVTAVPLLVLQRDGKTLESISGSDAVKVRSAIERHYISSEARDKKASLPPKLEILHRRDQDPTAPENSSTYHHPAAAATNGAGNSTAKKDSIDAPFSSSVPPTAPNPVPEGGSGTEPHQDELETRLAGLVKAAPVMLFMKGTPSAPQCGFSRQLVGILREHGVRYGFFNILADEDVRQGLKVFADWPTFPQLWVGGDLVGGLDIVKEELENDPDFFQEYSVRGVGGMAAPEAQRTPQTANA
ncbi:MAG: hypothetical protein LQ340_000410 [Diploschistes diacapsis]|nr:MAG: hypothetical protein LQ340_000410 [Diploschistes diacapsis]